MAGFVAGCSGGEPAPTASSNYFDGLDGAVVAEVLANPVAMRKVAEEPTSTRSSMAQGIVRNFEQCRTAFQAYQSWLTTGVVPAPPQLSDPAEPIEPSNAAVVQSARMISDALDSGDPGGLRHFLTGNGSCGQWIPAEPGDLKGQTIKAAVESLG